MRDCGTVLTIKLGPRQRCIALLNGEAHNRRGCVEWQLEMGAIVEVDRSCFRWARNRNARALATCNPYLATDSLSSVGDRQLLGDMGVWMTESGPAEM